VISLLRTRRWLSFTALVIIAIISFGLLSNWQWTRAEDKRKDQAAIAELSAVVLPDVSQAQEPWQTVSMEGYFDSNSTVVVRQRPFSGANGVWVVSLFRLTDGRTIWANRGWIAAARSASEIPEIPQAPVGDVVVNGYWVPEEVVTPQPGLPAGMVPGVAANVLPVASSIPGFVHVREPVPAEMLPIGPPKIDDGQNLSYAMQWAAFAFVAIGGWWIMLRREVKDQRSEN